MLKPLTLGLYLALLVAALPGCGQIIEVVQCDDPSIVGLPQSCAAQASDTSGDDSSSEIYNTGEIRWITQLGTGTRDNTDNLDPGCQVDAVDGSDVCNATTVDSSGNVYCAGYTTGALNDGAGGTSDAFVMKLNSSGVIQWITHLGTGTRDNTNGLDPNGQVDAVNGSDHCYDVSVDSSGNIYCAGYTTSALNDGASGTSDAFVMKLNSSGVIQWITHLGTGTRDNTNGLDPNGQVDAVDGNEYCESFSVDSSSNIYCAGSTTSALNDGAGGGVGGDAFVMKLNSSGVIQWITHLGTGTRDNTNGLDPNGQVDAVNGVDYCYGVSVDSSGNIYCAGYTQSALNDGDGGSGDAFVMKLNSSGVIQWITHLGTGTRDNTNGLNPNGQVDAVNGVDYCYGVSVDSSGNIFCAGYTTGALNDGAGGGVGSDAFVMKLNSSGVIQWITHLGTGTRDNTKGLDPNDQVDAVNGADICNAVNVDSSGNIYCAGYTIGALNDGAGGSGDAFVMKLNSSGVIQWITQLGTGTRDNANGLAPNGQVDAVNGDDYCNAVTVDSSGNVYCAGRTNSSLNDTNGGSQDAFVMRLQ